MNILIATINIRGIIIELPIAPISRILKNAGASKVSDDAKIALAEAIEDCGNVIAVKSVLFAHNTSRKWLK